MEYEYIDDPRSLAAAVERIRREPLLGVDTEAAGYHRYHDRLSLVQISTRAENLVIDPLVLEDLTALAPIFADPRIEKIFHDADFDLRILHRDLRMEVRTLFDTQIAAAFLGERQLGLGAIAEKYLALRLPKAHQRADWAERPLSASMLEYAATDTAYLAPLRDHLLAELDKLGRVEWAEEEFRRREATRWEEGEEDDDAFLRVKGSRDLTPRGLAILREVHRWREGVAEERDQATFRILGNQSLIEIGLKAPTTLAELRGIQGISAGLADRRGRDLIAAVKRGLAVPESDLPRFPPTRRWERDPAVEERADRLRRTRGEVANSLNLDPGFLISRALLDEVARRNPSTIEELAGIPDVRRWQVETLGDPILETLGS